MKTKSDSNEGDYRSLLILDEISKNEELTQLELSKRLGIAVGLINSYIKNLVSKGYVTVSTIPKRRYAYYLTPKGFVAQTRLTYHHLQNFTNLYRVARRDFRSLFKNISQAGITKLAFCGVDEIAEIAYISLQEAGLELEKFQVFDNASKGKRFFDYEVFPLEDVPGLDCELVLITSFKNSKEFTARLLELGIKQDVIIDISVEGWTNRFDNAGQGSE